MESLRVTFSFHKAKALQLSHAYPGKCKERDRSGAPTVHRGAAWMICDALNMFLIPHCNFLAIYFKAENTRSNQARRLN